MDTHGDLPQNLWGVFGNRSAVPVLMAVGFTVFSDNIRTQTTHHLIDEDNIATYAIPSLYHKWPKW